jgi:hypothetical protein
VALLTQLFSEGALVIEEAAVTFVFRAPCFADVSLSDWIARTPPLLVAQHLNVIEDTIAKFRQEQAGNRAALTRRVASMPVSTLKHG